MVVSDVIKIKYLKDNTLIEKELQSIGIIPLRWAVVEVQGDYMLVSVSYIK